MLDSLSKRKQVVRVCLNAAHWDLGQGHIKLPPLWELLWDFTGGCGNRVWFDHVFCLYWQTAASCGRTLCSIVNGNNPQTWWWTLAVRKTVKLEKMFYLALLVSETHEVCPSGGGCRDKNSGQRAIGRVPEERLLVGLMAINSGTMETICQNGFSMEKLVRRLKNMLWLYV